jgi:2-keto-3-deoxy-L-rhamnonate aldolase RhmA
MRIFSMEFKEKMQSGALLHGMIITMSLPSVSEMLSECGCDWLWIDMEHAPLSLNDVQQMAQAKRKECTALVRIPSNDEEWIKRVLDLGVEGIIIPHVNSAEEAKRAVDVSYYPPQGTRSVGCSRASRFGMDAQYKYEANTKRLLFVQIEHKEGVKNIDSIVQLYGIDGIVIGPYDLSGSYGKLGQIQDDEVVDAIEKVLNACKQSSKPAGIFAKNVEDAKRYLRQGFQLVAIGIDVQYLWNASKVAFDSVKNFLIEENRLPPASAASIASISQSSESP